MYYYECKLQKSILIKNPNAYSPLVQIMIGGITKSL